MFWEMEVGGPRECVYPLTQSTFINYPHPGARTFETHTVFGGHLPLSHHLRMYETVWACGRVRLRIETKIIYIVACYRIMCTDDVEHTYIYGIHIQYHPTYGLYILPLPARDKRSYKIRGGATKTFNLKRDVNDNRACTFEETVLSFWEWFLSAPSFWNLLSIGNDPLHMMVSALSTIGNGVYIYRR